METMEVKVDPPACRDCGAEKAKPCPVCTVDDGPDYGGRVGCIWCDSVKVVCPDGPHFTGIVNRAPPT